MILPLCMAKQGICERCAGTSEDHGPYCLVRRWIFGQHPQNPSLNQERAIEMAVAAITPRRAAIKPVTPIAYEQIELDLFSIAPSS